MSRRRKLKRRLAKTVARFVINPAVRAMARLGLWVPGTAILETRGRRTGRTRHTPITDGLDGDVFWIVAEHGRGAAFLHNLQADPRVRVRVGRRWRSGRATPLPDDDPRERLKHIVRRRPLSLPSAVAVRLLETEMLTVRIDLEP